MFFKNRGADLKTPYGEYYKLLIGSAKTQLILPGMIMLRRSSSNYRSSRSKNELSKFISRVTQIWYKLTSFSP
jgi:hypothetical protein